MRTLDIITTGADTFDAVVKDDGVMVCKRHYSDDFNCAYDHTHGSIETPFVSDALQAIIYRYGVQDVAILGSYSDAFEEAYGGNLTTYTRYPNNYLPNLKAEQVEQLKGKLFAMPDRELCEAVSAHFDSHPTLTGQKDLKTWAAEALKEHGILYPYQKDVMGHKFAQVQIQEVSMKDLPFKDNPGLLNDAGFVKTAERHDVSVYRMDAVIRCNADESVVVMGKDADGADVVLGRLPEKFLHKNPMNVDTCNAKLQLTDYSNEKMKNMTMKAVINVDEMSGDVIRLDNDMLPNMAQDNDLKIE